MRLYVDFVASFVAQSILHEVGHAVAVLLVGLRLREIHLGSERRRLVTIAGVDVFVGLGRRYFVRHEGPDGPRAVARKCLVTSAGPLVNLAGAPFAFSAGYGWGFAFVWVGILLGVTNLVPLAATGQRPYPSDGWSLLHARRVLAHDQDVRRTQEIRDEVDQVALSDTSSSSSERLGDLRRLARDPAAGAQASIALLRASWAAGRLPEDLPLLMSFVDGSQLRPWARAWLAHAITEALVAHDSEYRRDDVEALGIADRYSALAVEQNPTVPYLQSRTDVVRRLGRSADPLVTKQAWKLMAEDLPAEQRSQLSQLLAVAG